MSRRSEYAPSSGGPIVVAAALPVQGGEVGFLTHLVETVPEGTAVMTFAGESAEGVRPLRSPASVGLAVLLNEAMATNPEADLVTISEATRFPAGWLGRLREAAYADDVLAAAVPLVVGDPPLLGGTAVPASAKAPTTPIHPRIFLLHRHCSYLRRTGLQLVGPFDESLADPDAVLVDYSARCLARGLGVVLADDVLLERQTGAPPASRPGSPPLVGESYPWLAAVLAEERAPDVGPLRRSLVAARASGETLSVTIDARSLESGTSGTESYTAGLIAALSNSGRFRVRVLLRDSVDLRADTLPGAGEMTFIHEQEAKREPQRTDIAHRPQQVFVPEDVALLRQLGERVLISHLDLIGFRNPSYHSSPAEWQRYRRVTRFALGAADRVVFLSQHARDDAIAEELIELPSTAVVGSGIAPATRAHPASRPQQIPEDRPFVAMLGADYLHKNRTFALELLCQLQTRHGWPGVLVLAGKHVPYGGSAAMEAEILQRQPSLAGSVVDLGFIDSAERAWLLRNASAVLCPSVYEGFGLVPLEAADAGVPCVFAATTSLSDVVGPAIASIVPWDAAVTADRVIPLLHDGEPRRGHIELLQAALSRFDWERITEQLAQVYRDALASPYRSSVPRAWEELEREELIVALAKHAEARDRAYDDLHRRVEFGLPLIDRDGFLSRAQQRGLMRVASRRWLRGPVLGPIGLLGKAGARKKRAR